MSEGQPPAGGDGRQDADESQAPGPWHVPEPAGGPSSATPPAEPTAPTPPMPPMPSSTALPTTPGTEPSSPADTESAPPAAQPAAGDAPAADAEAAAPAAPAAPGETTGEAGGESGPSTSKLPPVPPDHMRIFQAAPPPPPVVEGAPPPPPPAAVYAPGGVLPAGRAPVTPYRERWNFAGGAVIGLAALALVFTAPDLVDRLGRSDFSDLAFADWGLWVSAGVAVIAVLMLVSGSAVAVGLASGLSLGFGVAAILSTKFWDDSTHWDSRGAGFTPDTPWALLAAFVVLGVLATFCIRRVRRA